MGSEVDPREVLTATYIYSRRTVVQGVAADTLWTALFMVGVGAIAGATGSRLFQYAILGVALGVGTMLISMHGFMEGVFRPAREAIAGDTGIGDSLPRSRPTFANWTNLSVTAAVFCAYLPVAL
ncbi:adenylate/guanylate cyclase domain-containing protein, partial [Mycolicibacterium austroafricanum]